VHAFGVESLVISHREQLGQHVAPDFGGAGLPRDPETVTATGNFNIEAAFDLPQMFIKLTAKIGKAVVIGRLENYVPRNLDSIQNLYL
jgi:hypothetical protein